MKLHILFFSILFFSINVLSQGTYKVIKVKGVIVLIKTQKNLFTGTFFNDNDKLKFKTDNAMAAVYKQGKGRFILKKNKSDALYAKANLSPALPTISSRGMGITSTKKLKEYFSNKLVLYDTIMIDFKIKETPITENNYFYLKYNYNGKEIDRNISCKNQTIYLLRSELFDVVDDSDYKEISDVRLYYKKSQNDQLLITSFTAVLLNKSEIEEEFKAIISIMPNQSNGKITKELKGFINDFYGKIDYKNTYKLFNKLKSK